MTFPTCAALVVACASALAVPAMADAVGTTIRVEGVDSTIIPTTAVEVPSSGDRTVADDVDAEVVTVPENSATAQLDRAAGALAAPLSFDLFDLGGGASSFVTRIGAEAAPADFSRLWRLKVDHIASSVGADEALLDDGAEVLWSLGAFDEPELDVIGPTAPVPAGTTFTVSVRSFDNAGAPSPAPGVSVAYGAAGATTDEAGRATLVADGAGPSSIEVRAPGAVRDAVPTCSHPVERPAVCDLAPLPGPATSSPARTPAATPPVAAGSVGGGSCRPLPERPVGGGDTSRIVPSERVLLRIQRYAQVSIRRNAAIERWIEDGVVGGDVCGGALDGSRFAGAPRSVTVATTAAVPSATPRPLVLGRVASATTRGGAGRADAALATATRRIVIAAMTRVRALERRLDGGLSGRDVVDGTLGRGRLTAGLDTTAVPAVASPPRADAPGRTPPVARTTPSAAAARVDMRVAVAGIRRSAALVDRLRAGLTAAQFAPGSLTASDLDPALRR